mmetsp:Transcript_15609/g.42039  ORF Transcript_15609/g.42039 Transcript_15609/m.42039 type:complete len:162 (+) Transcript_15609:74-559(+)
MAFGFMTALGARGTLVRGAGMCGALGRGRGGIRVTPSAMIRGFPNQFGSEAAGEPQPEKNASAEQASSDAQQGEYRAFNDLVDFPCVFTFKVIGLRQGQFAEDMCDCVASVLEIKSENVKVSVRDKGKYRSLTILAPCNNADQIYSIYAAIDRDPRVKFKF